MENYIICIGGFLAKQFSFSYNKVYLDILNNKKAEDNSSAFLLLSGKRDSNSQHSAWKADALPIELFPRCEDKYTLIFSTFARVFSIISITFF